MVQVCGTGHTESKIDSSIIKSTQINNGDQIKYYIDKSSVEKNTEIINSVVGMHSIISGAQLNNSSIFDSNVEDKAIVSDSAVSEKSKIFGGQIKNKSTITGGILSGDTIIDGGTVVGASFSDVKFTRSSFYSGGARNLSISNSLIFDGDISGGNVYCSIVMDSVLSKSSIINSIIDGEDFSTSSKTNNICPNISSDPEEDTCEEPQDLEECVGSSTARSQSFWERVKLKKVSF